MFTILSPGYTSITFLLLGGFFATLHSAYHLAGEAGIPRLKDKYPRSSKYLNYWENRWDLMRTSLLLMAMTMEILAIGYGILSVKNIWTLNVLGWILCSLLTVSLLAVFLWKLLPRALSESYADRLTVMFLPMTGLLTRALYLLAWPVARLEKTLLHLFMTGSDEEDRPSPEDEIKSVVDHANEEELEVEEREFIRSVLEFGDTVTREIMTPRVDAIGVEDTRTIAQAVSEIEHSSHSRFPVFHETMDDIKGIVHVKDLLRFLHHGKGHEPIEQIIKEATHVPETMPINDLLNLMRTVRTRLAVVVDEYGGTAGLVTREDVVEELIGDLKDEDEKSGSEIHQLSDGSMILDAKTPVDKANKLLTLNIPEKEDYDSLGGYVFQAMGRIPKPGETLSEDGYDITIQTANSHRLHTVRVLKKEETPG